MLYIIHFDQPIKHAQHYIGSTTKDTLKSVHARIKKHKTGTTNALLREVKRQGIGIQVYIIGKGSYKEERAIKNCNNGRRYCPCCMGKRRKALVI